MQHSNCPVIATSGPASLYWFHDFGLWTFVGSPVWHWLDINFKANWKKKAPVDFGELHVQIIGIYMPVFLKNLYNFWLVLSLWDHVDHETWWNSANHQTYIISSPISCLRIPNSQLGFHLREKRNQTEIQMAPMRLPGKYFAKVSLFFFYRFLVKKGNRKHIKPVVIQWYIMLPKW